MSVGSRQTRRRRRARRRRARLRELARIWLRASASTARRMRKPLYSAALVVSLVGAVASVFANEDTLILLFCLLALLLYVALWLGEG